jgi:kynurenine formamidase
MDTNGVMHFPGFSKEVAEFLTTQRCITGVGIDTFSLDNGPSKTFDCHMTMFKADKYQIENMNLENVPESGGVMIALPLKIDNAPEACARVIVVAPK